MSEVIVRPEKLQEFAAAALQEVGVKESEARIAAEIIVTADMRGTASHGIVALRTYVKQILCGGVDPDVDIEIVNEGPAWTLVDGHAGLGTLTAYKAAILAVNKARQSGVGVIGVRNGNHFAAAGYYSLMMTKENMIGIAMSNAAITLAVTGAAGRVIGNNPFSFATPAGEERPILLDIGMSVAAGGKINLARDEGRSIPLGWLIDSLGNPTTDPGDFARGGAMLPFGGHKGYGLALMIETLASVLTGAAITKDIGYWYKDVSEPCNVGSMFIAIDVGMFMPIDEYKTRMDHLIRLIRSAPRAPDVERIYLPGEIEQEKEDHARAEGVSVSDITIDSLRELASDLGLLEEFGRIVKLGGDDT
ncbi:MAG: Ldh family oxidoreductase [Armatimonadetes bacterium]|nr:Ldh family oxidoreductase [Armatimonadota bacterium]